MMDEPRVLSGTMQNETAHNDSVNISGVSEDSSFKISHQGNVDKRKGTAEGYKEEFNNTSTFNSLTAIADSYSDSDTDQDGTAMQVEYVGTMQNNNNVADSVKPLDQSCPAQKDDITDIYLPDVSPGLEMQQAPTVAKTSKHIDLNSADKVSSDSPITTTTTTTTTTEKSDNNHEVFKDSSVDGVYVMSIVGEELKSLDTCADNELVQPVAKDTAKADSPVGISLDDGSSSSESDDETSSDSAGDILDIRKRVAELEDLEEEKTVSSPPKTKDELSFKDLPNEPELEIEVDETVHLIQIGEVSSIVELLVIVRALPQTPALDSGSFLFLESREYIGMVFEIFGKVQSPYYAIRFNSRESMENKNLHSGVKVFFAPDVTEYSIFVFTAQLRQIKGSDASWKHDQEPPPELTEYSDDEQEAQAKSKRKQERKAKKTKEADDDVVEQKQKPQKQGVKVGRWSWRGQGRGHNSSAEPIMPQPHNSQPLHPAFRGPVPWSHGPPSVHAPTLFGPRPPSQMPMPPGYPRGPPPARQGLLPSAPIMLPPPGHPVGCAGPFMGNPGPLGGPHLGPPGFRHTVPMHRPRGQGPPEMGPYQYGPFHDTHIPPPPHGPPTSRPL